MEFIEEANKCLSKKTFFGNPKPDYDSAAQYLDKAAISFRTSRAFEQAVDAYVRAADAQVKCGTPYMAAKAMESAATICAQNLDQLVKAADLYQKTSELYIAHGSPDRAADCLERAARALENSNTEAAGDLYVQACEIFESEDKVRSGLETFRKTTVFFCRNKKLDRAIQASDKQCQIFLKIDNKHAFYKQALSTVILSLAYGDEVDAAKRMDQYAMFVWINLRVAGFMSTEEGKTAGDIIQAYESRDAEFVEECKKRQCIRFLDNEIGKIALSIKAPEGGAVPNQPPATFADLQSQIEEEGFC